MFRNEIKKGSAFIGTLKKYIPRHLHIVLTEPILNDDGEEVIVVNISSVYEKDTDDKVKDYDSTVVLTNKDHRSIKHLSYILYGRAKIIAVEYLEKDKKLKKERDLIILR